MGLQAKPRIPAIRDPPGNMLHIKSLNINVKISESCNILTLTESSAFISFFLPRRSCSTQVFVATSLPESGLHCPALHCTNQHRSAFNEAPLLLLDVASARWSGPTWPWGLACRAGFSGDGHCAFCLAEGEVAKIAYPGRIATGIEGSCHTCLATRVVDTCLCRPLCPRRGFATPLLG